MNWEIGTFKKEYENLKLQIEEYQDFWEWYEYEYGKTKADLFDEWKASGDEPQSTDSKLPIPFVRASALIKRFSEWNNKYPKGRIYSINSKDGMEMIRELDELADEAQKLNKHLP